MRSSFLPVITISLIFIATLSFSQAPPPKAVSAFDQQVIDQQKQFLQAVEDKNSAAVDRAIANDFQGVEKNGDLYGKDDLVESLTIGNAQRRAQLRFPRRRTERQLRHCCLQPDRPRSTSALSPYGRHLGENRRPMETKIPPDDAELVERRRSGLVSVTLFRTPLIDTSLVASVRFRA